MQQARRLLALLADGAVHPGPRLCTALGVERRDLRRMLNALYSLGVELHGLRGRGYRLAQPLDMLDESAVRAAMPVRAVPLLAGLEVLLEVDSTNRHLSRGAERGLGSGHACMAEHQSAGRGRRGRVWVSPLGANVYLSLMWRFDASLRELAALGLACGVAAAAALADVGVPGVGLKWPNDLVAGGAKLGGVLVEAAGAERGPVTVVTGVGINIAMPAAAGASIEQRWTDVRALCGSTRPARNRLAGVLLGRLLLACERFAANGFAGFAGDYARLDVLRGRPVEVLGRARLRGVADGVAANGALRVCTSTGTREITAGEVSVRARPREGAMEA